MPDGYTHDGSPPPPSVPSSIRAMAGREGEKEGRGGGGEEGRWSPTIPQHSLSGRWGRQKASKGFRNQTHAMCVHVHVMNVPAPLLLHYLGWDLCLAEAATKWHLHVQCPGFSQCVWGIFLRGPFTHTRTALGCSMARPAHAASLSYSVKTLQLVQNLTAFCFVFWHARRHGSFMLSLLCHSCACAHSVSLSP